jgi:hypothetical protein
LTSAVYLDKRADVDRYIEAMNHITAASTTSVQTIELICSMLEEQEDPSEQDHQRH